MLLSPLFFNISLEVLATAIRQEKEINTSKLEGRARLSLCADEIICIENSKDSTQKLLGLIKKFIRVAGYKQYSEINGFLYTNNEISKREYKQFILKLYPPK